MTKPKALGYVATAITGEVIEQLKSNDKAIFDIVTAVHAGDKDTIIIAARSILEIDRMARDVLTYLRAGEIELAREAILAAGAKGLIGQPLVDPDLKKGK